MMGPVFVTHFVGNGSDGNTRDTGHATGRDSSIMAQLILLISQKLTSILIIGIAVIAWFHLLVRLSVHQSETVGQPNYAWDCPIVLWSVSGYLFIILLSIFLSPQEKNLRKRIQIHLSRLHYLDMWQQLIMMQWATTHGWVHRLLDQFLTTDLNYSLAIVDRTCNTQTAHSSWDWPQL